MLLEDLIIETLKKEVVPAIGCTEPVAVALACARAREIINNTEIDHIDIRVSPNVYKNGLSVGVPPTNEVGLWIAGALGFIGGASVKGLQVLDCIEEEQIEIAKRLVKDKKIKLQIQDTIEKVYVDVRAYCKGASSRVIIKDKHNNFVYSEGNGKVIENVLENSANVKNTKQENTLYTFKIREIIEAIERITHKSIDFMLEGYYMNERVAMAGLNENTGMGVGYTLNKNIKKGILSNDFMSYARALTAAASDARMAGLKMPVMSSNGSGNNGLTAILPIVAYSKKFKVSNDKLAKAIAMSHIINSYIKNYIGRLSVLCGCGVSAGTGAAVAITWLMGGSIHHIEGAIKNILADISGIVCDGAKVGCALKLSTSVASAIQAALLAIDNRIVPTGNGLIAETVEDTIKNLQILSNEGMKDTDKAIIMVMQRAYVS
ncbi:serine dehydratase subunit alpha family protein [Alkaliphilus pronyensis]|uniref:UPF0597 protein F8154_12800 n=1 Tax=Alkaliphilus pronyensis TaxID=1482732 RepID=A0A6I0F836_9FIRM|nr:L-serine ammonia-lyase, iron-sulfur-dependent, subunit alpha [Alkaliphilus pronyensis]KAB3531297.1 serine dehydratase subunit alpha family protein [Alkaliphilus pronyensis]